MNISFKNTGYFLREGKTIFGLNLLSNILSLLSIGLVFFILALVITGWQVSGNVIEVIQEEAEISVYYRSGISSDEVSGLVNSINNINGIYEARFVKEDEAYSRMERILGKDASVLENFDENPFSPFIEVKINLEDMDAVISELKSLDEIEHIRDNREVLEKLKSLSDTIKLLGLLVLSAIGITTFIIISHIIRQGIYNNKEQINTLRLLGAPEVFIGFPYVMSGLLLTVGGGILGSSAAIMIINSAYTNMVGGGPLPFIPMPPQKDLILNLSLYITIISIALGLFGSLFGLSSSKGK